MWYLPLCKYLSTLSRNKLPFFCNVPLTTECSSLRNMFSHFVRKDIMGEIQDCELHLELSLNNPQKYVV